MITSRNRIVTALPLTSRSTPKTFGNARYGRGPLSSFCPETALFRNLGVNLCICLCGVKCYASAQTLDFLDLAENCWFGNQKRTQHPSGVSGWALSRFTAGPLPLTHSNKPSASARGFKQISSNLIIPLRLTLPLSIFIFLINRQSPVTQTGN